MADDSLEIVIHSKGGEQVVASFRAIADGSAKMGTTVEQSSQKSSRSLDDVNKRMAALGAVATSAAAILGQWSRSSQDAEAIQRQLEASIAATGQSFDQYAARIEEVGRRAVQLGQDDEAASQAISALTQITGSANTALNEMGLVFDLAAAKGLSLESAAELVGRVMEGNTGILQRYGIVVKDGATAEEALAQVQQQVAGQAEAHATTYARLREELSNVTDAIGGAVGGFAPMLSLLPGVSSGLTLMGGAAGALAPNLTKAAAASAALDLALGPVGIVLAAGAAAFAIYELTKGTDEYAKAAEAATTATGDLGAVINALAARGSPKAIIAENDLAVLQSAVAQMGNLQQAEEALAAARERLDKARKSQGGSEQEQAMRQAAIAQLEQEVANTERVVEALRDVPDAIQAIGDVFADTGTGAGLAQEALAKLFADFAKTGDIVALIEGLSALNDDLGKFDDAANKAASSTGGLQAALAGLPLEPSAGLVDRLTGKIKSAGDASAGAAPKVDALGDAIARATDAMRPDVLNPNVEGSTGRLARDLDTITEAVGTAGDVARQRAVALGDALKANTITLAEYEKQIHAIAQPLAAAAETVDALTAAQDRQAYAQATWAQNMADAAADAEAFRAQLGQLSGGGSALDEFTAALRANETALERMARGSTSAGVALRAFKDIQDSLLAQQDVFNQQYSEYGSQLSAIERAQDILNQRVEDGIPLTKEQQEFLDGAAAATERLTGGQEDAAVQAGILAERYGENVSAGDRLNQTLDGVSGAADTLADSVDRLTLALVLLDGTDAEPEIALAGADIAADTLIKIGDQLAFIDGFSANATVNVGANISPDLNKFGFRDGGIAGYANGGVTIRAGEAGYELLDFPSGRHGIAATDGLYTVPQGTMVTPHPASVDRVGGGGGMTLNLNVGTVNGFSDLDAFFAAAAQAARAHFAGMGA